MAISFPVGVPHNVVSTNADFSLCMGYWGNSALVETFKGMIQIKFVAQKNKMTVSFPVELNLGSYGFQWWSFHLYVLIFKKIQIIWPN